MDYGDGVFPCKWPSEVVQDEVQGWMLRVAPIRVPVATFTSGWEEYLNDGEGPAENDPKNKKIGGGKKSMFESATGAPPVVKKFYFNRNTFEASYDVPLEVQQEMDLAALKAANAQQMGGYYDENMKWVPNNVYLDSWAATANAADFTILPNPTPRQLLPYSTGGRDRSRTGTSRRGPLESAREEGQYSGRYSTQDVPVHNTKRALFPDSARKY
jgi:hypothetical protein